MDNSVKRQLLVLIAKLLLLIMFFQVLTLVGGLVLGNLLNQIYPTLEFQNSQAFTASTVATLSMIAGTFALAWLVYKNKIKTFVAAIIITIPVFALWMLVLLFYT